MATIKSSMTEKLCHLILILPCNEILFIKILCSLTKPHIHIHTQCIIDRNKD